MIRGHPGGAGSSARTDGLHRHVCSDYPRTPASQSDRRRGVPGLEDGAVPTRARLASCWEAHRSQAETRLPRNLSTPRGISPTRRAARDHGRTRARQDGVDELVALLSEVRGIRACLALVPRPAFWAPATLWGAPRAVPPRHRRPPGARARSASGRAPRSRRSRADDATRSRPGAVALRAGSACRQPCAAAILWQLFVTYPPHVQHTGGRP